jgi:molybdate transport repressor ModE-like protein
MTVELDIRWRLGGRSAVEFEPQLFALLEEIGTCGSVLEASRTLGLSYRHAWGMLKKWSKLLNGPLALLERGRGAKLSALGEKILWAQHRAKARLAPELESLASELNGEIDAVVKARREAPLRIFASHGLALGVLRDTVREDAGVTLDLQFKGSLDSLRLFSSGKCDLAGFHLPEGRHGDRLASRYRRYLDNTADQLIHVVRREQGIYTARGNPKRIKSVADLARKGIRFVNRQPAAGTRLLFDLLLEDAGVEAESIRGYRTEEFTHMAVAAMVASGAADAGFGIRAAAAQLGIGFVPVVMEDYYFAIRREGLYRAPVKALCQVLRDPGFRGRVATLPGYDAAGAGTVLGIDQVCRR